MVRLRRAAFQAGEGEHLVNHLEDQHILPEREPFDDKGLGQAVVADLIDVEVICYSNMKIAQG
jgi:hypothetical protein